MGKLLNFMKITWNLLKWKNVTRKNHWNLDQLFMRKYLNLKSSAWLTKYMRNACLSYTILHDIQFLKPNKIAFNLLSFGKQGGCKGVRRPLKAYITLGRLLTWISYHVHGKVWDGIICTNPFDIEEWINNFSPQFCGPMITYPFCELS